MNRFQKQLSRFKKRQQFLAIGVFALTAVVFWVIGSIISSQRTTGISSELLALSRPLNPNINEEVIAELENKRAFSPEELSFFSIYKIIKTRDGNEQRVVTIDTDPELLDQILIEEQQNQPPPAGPAAGFLGPGLVPEGGLPGEGAEEEASSQPPPATGSGETSPENSGPPVIQ